ncbi:MAG: hypothetical protein K8T90_06050 [Planctomycetes bacterium]|nr:hypothetical protein [Planctomycetota bacterium]
MARRPWPPWWTWELELSVHVMKRMIDRRFTDIELRAMLDAATDLRRDIEPGRWVAVTRHHRRPREVIVEPDRLSRVIVGHGL